MKAGTLSSVDVMDDALARIAAVDGTLESFVCLATGAREQAVAADRAIRAGGGRGPLRAEDESVPAASWRLTYPWNLAGLPAISLPYGFDRHGLPIGLQLAARPFDELTLIRTADFYERAHDWKDRRPSI